MFQIDDDMTIYITRGDVAFFSVTADNNGKNYMFQPGDVVRIKVTEKKACENVMFQKDFPVTRETERVDILLTEEETKIGEVISKPTDYWYEIELNPYTNPQTIVGYDDDGAKIFKLFPEGRDLGPTPVTPEDIPVVDDELSLTSDRPVQNQAIARAITGLGADIKYVRDSGSERMATIEGKIAAEASRRSEDVLRLNEDIAVERARISTLVANAGNTDGNAELLDIRVGADGKTYATAGDAVRGQIGDLKSDLSECKSASFVQTYDFKEMSDYDWVYGKFFAYNGYEVDSATGVHTNKIPLKVNYAIRISGRVRGDAPAYLLYDEDSNLIQSYIQNGSSPTVFDETLIVSDILSIHQNAVYIVVNGLDYSTYPLNVSVISLYGEKVSDIITDDVLYNKKWVACGDSFTEGDYTNSPTNDYVFESGLYKGEKKVYPFFIGRRNKMVVVNEAKSGSYITHSENRTDAFSDTRYTNIPADADYITIKIGINDSSNNVPIGTINDTTNTTFYGAWNVVLEHLVTNHPFAKIGVIITNGAKKEYADAEIAVCEKWGIPYLNEAYGKDIPLMLRSNRSEVSEVAKNVRNSAFSVKWGTNNHPNAKSHEFESTIVEAWLRTL